MNTNIENQFSIKWETDDELTSCYIDADKDMLKRAISNLIQNSVDHNASGCEIFVSISTESKSCIITVEDDGTGASNEQIEMLNHVSNTMIYDMENMNNVCSDEQITNDSIEPTGVLTYDTNTTEQHGLGLRIVKQIMNSHGGRVVITHSSRGGLKTELILPQ